MAAGWIPVLTAAALLGCGGPDRSRYPAAVAEGSGIDPTAGLAAPDTSIDGPTRAADFPDLLELDPAGDLVHAWLGQVRIDGPLPAERVEGEVLEAERPIRHCYTNALRRHEDTNGDVIFAAVVAWPGDVADLRVVDNTTGDRGLATCIENALLDIYFEGAPRQIEIPIRIPFRFATGPLPGKDPAVASEAGASEAGASEAGASEAAAVEGGSATAEVWYDGQVFYEVFVRSFADSDGDGVGDLQGLIARLDYLNDGRPGEGDDLEVDGLWLMPVFESPSYHGYDTVDYRAIERDYGTAADFQALLDAAHARGMRVIVDFVVNHTSSQHPWFLVSRQGPGSPLRSYYVWRTDDPGWTQPWGASPTWHEYDGWYYYGLFWSGMPDLNYGEPAVVEAMTDVAGEWLERGVDGYRLDAIRYVIERPAGGQSDLPETHAMLRRLRADLEAVDPDVYLVGEAWTDRAAVVGYWGGGDELHQAFDFDLQGALAEAVTGGGPARLAAELAEQRAAGAPWSFAATFLGNHDISRLAARLPEAWQQRAAAVLLLTLPGTPYIYYGDEIGMAAGSGTGDEAKRTPMPWDGSAHGGFTSGEPWYPLAAGHEAANVATQLGDPGSLLNLYRELVRLRHAHPALAGGGLEVIEIAAPGVFAMLRYDESNVYIVIVNLGAAEVDPGVVDLSSWGVTAGPVETVFGEGSGSVDSAAAVSLGPALGEGQGRVLRLSR